MPLIRPYPEVLAAMQSMGLVSNYYNSGAFGFERGAAIQFRGWIGPDDPTIRDAARSFIRQVPPPFDEHLATLALEAWQALSAGVAWVLPMSHWAFEMDHGSRDWIPQALADIGVDPAPLAELTSAAAIEFAPSEATGLAALLRQLLTRLTASDFALLLPGVPLTCTIHHHQQLWWVCRSDELMGKIDAVAMP